MDGFLNVNKSTGMTSFDVIRRLKRIFPGAKMGHTGTLDPMAQGALPVAFGNATRVLEYIDNDDKVYLAQMTLGGISDTQDAWGQIEYKSIKEFDRSRLENIINDFIGPIKQIPPMYSAVHHQGQRLYDLARQGKVVEREPRDATIYALDLLEEGLNIDGYPTFKIRVSCSKGTYIRTLCHDIGECLGTGGYLSELTRVQAGPFLIEESFDLDYIAGSDDVFNKLFKKIDFPLYHLPLIDLTSDSQIQRIYHGNSIVFEHQIREGIYRVYDQFGNLVSIAKITGSTQESTLQPLKVFKQS